MTSQFLTQFLMLLGKRKVPVPATPVSDRLQRRDSTASTRSDA